MGGAGWPVIAASAAFVAVCEAEHVSGFTPVTRAIARLLTLGCKLLTVGRVDRASSQCRCLLKVETDGARVAFAVSRWSIADLDMHSCRAISARVTPHPRICLRVLQLSRPLSATVGPRAH